MRYFLVIALLAVVACNGGEDIVQPPAPGTLEVRTTTTGVEIDPDGYTIQIDTTAPQPIGVSETLRSSQPEGSHTVALAGLASNCSVEGGADPQSVEVIAGETATITFAITCAPTTGSLTVTASTSGEFPDPDGYAITLDGGTAQPIGTVATITLPVSPGTHSVTLTGLAANCAVSGDNPRSVMVQAGSTAIIEFAITCEAVALQWQPIATGAGSGLTGIWGSSPADLFAVGERVIVHYDGREWTRQFSRSDVILLRIWGSSATDVFAVGGAARNSAGALLHYDGSSWSDMTAPLLPDVFYLGVWGSSGSDVYAVGEYFEGREVALIAHFDGGTWSQVALEGPDFQVATAVHGTSATDVYVSGYYSQGDGYFVLHYDGSSWNRESVFEDGVLNGIWANAPNDVFAVGFGVDGGFITHFDGQSFSLMEIPPTPSPLLDVWGTSGSDVYAVSGSGILHYDGSQWTEISNERGFGVFGLSPTDVYVGQGNGRILHGTP